MALNSNFRTLTANNIEGIVDERNYLSSSFENGTLTGWTEMSVALTSGLPTGTPTISSTAASSLALSTTTSTPLSGSRSMLMTVASALTAGHGFISQEFTLDRMDLGKVLTVSFDYERISGTYNFSGTLGSQTLMVYIYDATAGGANWIQPAGFLGMNQSSGPGRVACTFQSSVTAGQKYRVAVIASQAAAGASSIEFDNFTCSRQTAPIGPVVTDWVSYTPTFTSWGTVSNVSVYSRRVGDSLEVEGRFTAGTTAAATAFMTLGFNGVNGNVTVDGAKLNGFYVVGSGAGQFSSATWFSSFKITTSGGAPSVGFGVESSTTPGYSGSFGTSFGNNGVYSFYLKVPITGWSSNVQLSNDTDTRVVAARMFRSTTQAITGTAFNKVLLNSSSFDTHSAFDSANSLYRIPVSGFYRVTGCIYGSAITSSFVQTRLAKNGTGFADAFQIAGSTSDALAIATDIVQCNAGDTIELFVASGDSSYTVQNSSNTTYLSIERLSGPSVVAASDTVAMGARNSSGQSIPNGSSTTITNWTKTFDTHGAFNATTGLYTVPVSGKYLISGGVGYQVGALSIGNQCSVQIQINGTDYQVIGGMFAQSTATANMAANGSVEIQCVAGDVLRLQTFQSMGGARSLLVDLTWNYFSIIRVGN